ncbi:MAG TPA: ABC transporter ATP-binding protein [Acidimicrobiales bacterium]|nr:ABC transporter ATP-binding protein [Acidimicrobiales bacterium]
MATAEMAIEVTSLRMAYGDTEVVHGIDLAVTRGEVFTVLGPNGAGKTTTIEILEGFRRRTGGNVRVLGADPWKAGARWRERIGVVLQSSTPEPELTVAETVDLYAGFYDHPVPTATVLELCGITAQARTRNQRLSGGQQRRLDVALALVGDPELMFLDEPTTGFDPAARRSAWSMISGLKERGTTIVLTTHYLEEAETLSDRIAVIDAGRIVAAGTPATLGGRDHAPTDITFRLPVGAAPPPAPGCASVGGGRQRVRSSDPTRDLHELTQWALGRGLTLEDLDVRRPSLEDVYLQLTSESKKEVAV